MTDEFLELKRALRGETTAKEAAQTVSEPSYARLLMALADAADSETGLLGAADAAVLVRHALRRETERQHGHAQNVVVKAVEPWKLVLDWEQHGLRALKLSDGSIRLEASEWVPSWLPGSREKPPLRAVFSEERRRRTESVEGDPFLSLIGHKRYLSAGQKRAVRAVLCAPPGATLVVNLPTGLGKSTCAHMPALVSEHTRGTVVVVVPTTTLCLDQERAIAALIRHPTAYYGSVNHGADIREQIRNRIREGTQRIIFASPESLKGSLVSCLYSAAADDLIRLLAIDEAHLVAEWGTEFRSAFQEISGLRRGLLRVSQSGFPTLLMTATLTAQTLAVIQSLFSGPGEFRLFSSVHLRPEPEYWHCDCGTDEELKRKRTLEAVRHTPRPAILYTTRVDDARRWFTRLTETGFKRIACVTGRTSSSKRRQIMHDWRNGAVDLVVATSAFGLGVDQADVGAVIHACVPETVDRFYQEVGRGGRDGTASLSLLLYTERDLHTARALNRTTVISPARGLRRWRSMFEAGHKLADHLVQVRLDTRPGYRGADLDMQNDLSQEWNARTLTLMARAGLIDLDSVAPPAYERPTSNSKEQADRWSQAWERYRKTRSVSIRRHDHLEQETWDTDVEQARQDSLRACDRSAALLREFLRGEKCVSEVLKQVYYIPSQDNSVTSVRVAGACGGCPACRRADCEPYTKLPSPSLSLIHI